MAFVVLIVCFFYGVKRTKLPINLIVKIVEAPNKICNLLYYL